MIERGIIQYQSESLARIPEIAARDRQAPGYLHHSKLPTQIARLRQFLDRVPQTSGRVPVLELGCGPGPLTPLLIARGWDTLSVDFSETSLAVNSSTLPHDRRDAATYVRADLNALRLQPESTNLLLMCDFLQHLGNRAKRDAFLAKAFGWLRPGGRFYVSFFNLNLKNRLRRDVRGAFADGAIRYERLRSRDVLAALPSKVTIDAVMPMNVFHGARLDRLASSLPGAALAARMMAISGRKS